MADRSDPFDTLKESDVAETGTPLPAAEVRALGDRMRRRRTAFRAVAAAAAVAVVTTGGVTLGAQLSGSPAPIPPATQQPSPSSSETPSPAPSQSKSDPPQTAAWVTEIPESFPLAAGWPDAAATGDGSDGLTGPGRDLEPLALDACGRSVPEPSSTDRLNAVWRNVVTALSRELRVFPSDQEAVTYLAHLRNLWQECDPEEAEHGLLTVVHPTTLGEESFALVTGSQLDQDTAVTLGVVQVVRVGNAVFADEIGTEGGQPDMGDELTAVLADMAKDSARVVEAMRVFAGDPSEGAPPQTFAWVTEIPRSLPLAMGYPEDRFEETELTPPGPEVKLPYLDQALATACGGGGQPTTEPEDRLATSFTQPEDLRSRQLTTYPDDATAEAVVTGIVDAFEQCPRSTDDLGWATLTEVRGVEPGDEGHVAIRTSELDGSPAPGLELVYVVRVGNAVLIQSTSGEGGGNEKAVYAQVLEQTRQVAALTEEMCVFSRGGC